MGTVHHAPACSVASTTVPIQEPQPACFCKFLACRRLARALSVQMANTGQRYRVAQLMIGERTRGPALASFQSRRLWVSAADRRQSRSAIPIFATAQGASMYSRARGQMRLRSRLGSSPPNNRFTHSLSGNCLVCGGRSHRAVASAFRWISCHDVGDLVVRVVIVFDVRL